MAEYLARSHAHRTHVEAEVLSAGTLGLVDRPAHPKMIAVGAEVGLDLSPHVCQPVADELTQWADHILVMEFMHLAYVQEFHQHAAQKVVLLGQQIGRDEIADPIGAWTKWTYRRCRDQLATAVHRFMDQLPTEHP
jgi:protein-tyrosine-phosphatase